MRFISDDLPDTFTNICNGIVVDGIWNSSARYVTCTNQMGSCVVGIGMFVCGRFRRSDYSSLRRIGKCPAGRSLVARNLPSAGVPRRYSLALLPIEGEPGAGRKISRAFASAAT